MTNHGGDNPFQFLEALGPQEVADCLRGELSFVQGAALCLLSPLFSAKVMACMDDARRQEIAAAMSKSRQMPRDVLKDIADELRKKGLGAKGSTKSAASAISSAVGKPASGATGLTSLANLKNIFNKPAAKPEKTSFSLAGRADIGASQAAAPDRRKQLISETLARAKSKAQPTLRTGGAGGHPAAAPGKGGARHIDGMALAAHILREAGNSVRENVRHELPDLYRRLHDRMFDFADLEHSGRETLGAVFTGVEVKTAARALRFASDSLRGKVLESVSERRAQLLRDEMAAAGAERVKLSSIDDAQQAVIDFAVRLQDQGRILIDPNDPGLV